VSNWIGRREIVVRLAPCDTAVNLLSEKAFASRWVLKKASIVTWRSALANSDWFLEPDTVTHSNT
jgi:hypothetical protein